MSPSIHSQNIGWIKRLFTAWRVSHAERKEAGEDDPEEDETPVLRVPLGLKGWALGRLRLKRLKPA